MNLINRMMSYDKTKVENQEQCNCDECVSTENVKSENQIIEYPKLSEEEIEQIISERYSNKDEKTKKFIRESLKVHGDKYNYFNVIFIKNIEKVEIICRVEGHEPFLQTPHNHKLGHGCKLCGIKLAHDKTKMTFEEFIERARKIHGDKYDYSKVNYIDIKTEVIIICSKHGDFKQIPNDHLNSHGCSKCQYEKLADLFKLSLEEFIEKANRVHGLGRYNYSKVKYVNNNTNVIIICNKHETPYEFPQTPNTHLSGEGCPKCKNNYKGEIAIRNFLTEYKIEFKEQKRFNDCKDSNTLPFDFYLPQYNLCIEFDGIQHFKPIKRSKIMSDEQAEKNLKYTQNHDNIKTKYCKNNGINLLRIRYDENVEEKLTEYFQNNNIIKD